jgi:hypothetical protein
MSSLRVTVIDHKLGERIVDTTCSEFPLRIGREGDNDVVLAYPFVSRWHAEVRRDGDVLALYVLGARNELGIGERRLAAGACLPLAERVVAAIGPLELRFDPSPPPAKLGAPAEDRDEGPSFSLSAAREPQKLRTGDIDDARPPFDLLPGEAIVHAERLARLNAAVHGLRPVHAALVAARRAWDTALSRAIQALQAADPASVGTLLHEFPRLDWLGHAPAGTDAFSDEQRRGAVVQAAAELLPGLRVPADDDESRRFLARVIDVLRVFAACTLELRHVRSKQATELDVTWRDESDALSAMETPATMLAYLLDWRESGERRSEELVRMFAGLVDHQRAYARAGLLAAREAVASLAPEEIERGAQASWPSRSAALWRHYETCYAALAGGDAHDDLTPLFRAVLARSYREALARAGVPLRAPPVLEGP